MAVRVLIADSSLITRDILRNHLVCGGCQVVAETVTLPQTIDLFRTTRPDVITVGIGLLSSTPGIDTLSLFRTIRRELPAALVLLISASRSLDNQRVYQRTGSVEHITESFDSFGLKQVWRQLSDAYPELRRSHEIGLRRRI
jgi:CheY-like chemotaxis protein